MDVSCFSFLFALNQFACGINKVYSIVLLRIYFVFWIALPSNQIPLDHHVDLTNYLEFIFSTHPPLCAFNRARNGFEGRLLESLCQTIFASHLPCAVVLRLNICQAIPYLKCYTLMLFTLFKNGHKKYEDMVGELSDFSDPISPVSRATLAPKIPLVHRTWHYKVLSLWHLQSSSGEKPLWVWWFHDLNEKE